MPILAFNDTNIVFVAFPPKLGLFSYSEHLIGINIRAGVTIVFGIASRIGDCILMKLPIYT